MEKSNEEIARINEVRRKEWAKLSPDEAWRLTSSSRDFNFCNGEYIILRGGQYPQKQHGSLSAFDEYLTTDNREIAARALFDEHYWIPELPAGKTINDIVNKNLLRPRCSKYIRRINGMIAEDTSLHCVRKKGYAIDWSRRDEFFNGMVYLKPAELICFE